MSLSLPVSVRQNSTVLFLGAYIAFVTILFLTVPKIALAQELQQPQHRSPISAVEKLERANALRDAQLNLGTQTAPAPKAPEDLTGAAWRMFQGLGIVVGLLLIGAWAYKKYVLKDQPVQSRRLKILERHILGPRSSLLLLEVDSQKVLVGMSPSQITLLQISEDTNNSQSKSVNADKDFAVTLSKELT